jgi:hypothetical protein
MQGLEVVSAARKGYEVLLPLVAATLLIPRWMSAAVLVATTATTTTTAISSSSPTAPSLFAPCVVYRFLPCLVPDRGRCCWLRGGLGFPVRCRTRAPFLAWARHFCLRCLEVVDCGKDDASECGNAVEFKTLGPPHQVSRDRSLTMTFTFAFTSAVNFTYQMPWRVNRRGVLDRRISVYSSHSNTLDKIHRSALLSHERTPAHGSTSFLT